MTVMATDQTSLQERLDALKRAEADSSTMLEGDTDLYPVEGARIVDPEGIERDAFDGRDGDVNEKALSGPVGLDIGTSHIVVARNSDGDVITANQLNAFFTLPNSKFAKEILLRNNVLFFEHDNLYYITGYSAENFANMFDTDTRRSIKQGLLCSDEKDGLKVIEAIISSIIPEPSAPGTPLCFSIPGEPVEGVGSVTYHESVIKMLIKRIGFTPVSINEGMAVVIAELADRDYTGIGISIGGGMCNFCLSYLSFPVITYSIRIGGDYIDSSAGAVVGIPSTRVKAVKENDFSLSRTPDDRVSTAIGIFYNELIQKLQKSMERVLSTSNRIPMISKPVPVVLSGGSAMPEGFTEKFEASLSDIRLPFEISSVSLAKDPLNTTAKGALIMASSER